MLFPAWLRRGPPGAASREPQAQPNEVMGEVLSKGKNQQHGYNTKALQFRRADPASLKQIIDVDFRGV